jgi:hypothetical protein
MLPDINKLLQPRPRKFRNIVRHLPQDLVTIDTSDGYTEQDLFTDLTAGRGTDRFLGFFSARGIAFTLRRFGVMDLLAKAGLPDGQVVLDVTDPYLHRLSVIHFVEGQKILSSELSVRRGPLALPGTQYGNPVVLDYIIVEWLLLQNPCRGFTRQRPQLPGQEHPGLGIGGLVYEMLYWAARRLEADGVLIIPNYLHTGLFYGRQFLFLDPTRQGQLYALSKLIPRKYRLDQLTWACAEGQLIDRTQDQVFLWEPAPMALPVTRRLKDYFHSAGYVQRVRMERARFRVEINPGYRKNYTKDWKAR